MVQRLEVAIDLLRIRQETKVLLQKFDFLESREIKQLMLTCRAGDENPDFDGTGKQDPSLGNEQYQRQFDRLNPIIEGTYFEEVLKTFPYEYGRVRLMILNENRCYSVHVDKQPRYHLAIWTDPKSYLLYKGYSTWFHIPSDGYFYQVHTCKPHTAINCGSEMRVHLVFDSIAGY